MTIEIPLSVLVALFAINGGTLTAFIGVIVLLALRLGRLPTREEHNELRNELKADIGELRNELKADIGELRNELKADIGELRNELKADMGELRNELKADTGELRNELKADTAGLREDFRRSHQQMLTALAGHTHNEDGQAVFTAPPEMDAMPAPADD